MSDHESRLTKAELLVDKWLMDDFFEPTRTEVVEWLRQGKFDEIFSRLSGDKRLVFGTAGLRARMGAGYDRMNTLTVMLATQGLIDYLNCLSGPGENRVVIIGFDGRHNSESFAHVTASLFLLKKFRVKMIDRPSPTPFNPFLVSHTPGAVCGIQITASHNPKSDNGYKLYWSNGAQIVPPLDSLIAARMDENFGKVWTDVFGEILDATTCRIRKKFIPQENLEFVFDSVLESYSDAICDDVCVRVCDDGSRSLKFAYTAMHGVGYEPFRYVFSRFGFDESLCLSAVVEQVHVDPEFPTVAFPNPEEKGALRLAIDHAEKNACQFVLANDPDADRFTCVEKQRDGSWYQFSGDELGLLFCDWRMRTGGTKNGLIVSSVVSSQMARALCRARGYTYSDCLTGFKWIANESIRMRKESSGNVLKHLLGYEEAIGYQVTSVVPDKDGISAGCVWAQMAVYWNSQEQDGKKMKERFDEIQANEIGFFVTNNGYYVIEDVSVTKAIFEAFRNSGMKSLGGEKIKSVRDVTRGIDTSGEACHLPKTPEAEMITIFFENGAVVTIRASGTEPKVKFYSELSSRESVSQAKRELDEIVAIIKRDFYQPDKFPIKEQTVM